VQLAGFAIDLASDGLTADSQWSWQLRTMPDQTPSLGIGAHVAELRQALGVQVGPEHALPQPPPRHSPACRGGSAPAPWPPPTRPATAP